MAGFTAKVNGVFDRPRRAAAGTALHGSEAPATVLPQRRHFVSRDHARGRVFGVFFAGTPIVGYHESVRQTPKHTLANHMGTLDEPCYRLRLDDAPAKPSPRPWERPMTLRGETPAADIPAARNPHGGHDASASSTSRRTAAKAAGASGPREPRPERIDFCILGAGAAGRLVALKAAEAGASAMLVAPPDQPPPLTGLFFAPHALIEAANLHHETALGRSTGLYGDEAPLQAPAPRPSGEGLVRHMRHMGEALAGRVSDARLRALRVSTATEPAQFQDARTLRVGNRRIVARRFVLAPGLEWEIPAIPGINEIDYLTPDRPLVASRPVERLAVIGLSDAGIALAQAHRRLGASVTLLPSPADDPARFDDEIFRQALMGLIRDGVAVHFDIAVSRIEAHGREAIVHTAGGNAAGRLEPGQVLLAPRLRPLFTDPGWAAAQIALKDGAPVLDADLRTSNRRVQVAGALAGDDTFSFHLERDADFIVDGALHGRMPARIVPMRYIPTTPGIAVVGLDERAARRAHGRIGVVRAPHARHPAVLARPRGTEPLAGETKIIADGKRRIVGCAIAGDRAGELAGLWSLAVARRLTLDDVGGLAFPDIVRHSLSRRATRLAVFGWPQSRGLLWRLARLWRKLRG